ncbi:MAG: HEPN/Toprim-associated domain-containing protein [Rhodospirillales bacterium]|nr:HEPN/Toprim-associated domain-containing protein [Rhodospirillales bacterium]
MGTEISLDIAGLSVDWSKNRRGADHGFLFQSDDRRRIPCEDDYPDDDPGRSLREMAFIRPLRSVLPRLELLGHTLATAEADYERVAAVCVEDRRSLREEGIGEELPLELMSFGEFKEFVTGDAIADLDDSFSSDLTDEGKRRTKGRLADNTITGRVPTTDAFDVDGYSERSFFGSLIGFLHPYNVLRLLAENERNVHADLEWRYGPLVCDGWAQEEEFISEARRAQTFLIATEGKSDTRIIKHAISLLRPEIADFFRFVDVGKGYPFTGAGNLLRFAQGLAKIDVHNQTLFVLDNDAEGVNVHGRITELALPANMRAATLPELARFGNFKSRGSDGKGTADINGRAAAIECYLDLRSERKSPAEVVWSADKKDLDVRQGKLVNKGTYTKTFLKRASTIKGYDMSGLMAVLDMIFAECRAIAETAYSIRTAALR